MVKHLVLWKLREFDARAEREEAVRTIKSGLESLVGVVPGLRAAQVGENFTPDAYDLGLCAEFDSREALDEYQTHPAHMKVRKFIHTVIVQRAVCDWEC